MENLDKTDFRERRAGSMLILAGTPSCQYTVRWCWRFKENWFLKSKNELKLSTMLASVK